MPKFSLKSLSRALRIVAWLSVIFTVLPFVEFLTESNSPIGLPTTDEAGIWNAGSAQLSLGDRLLVLLAAGFPSFIWIFALTRMLTIAKRVSRGDVLVPPNCQSLTHFSIALFLFGIGTSFSDLLVAVVLDSQGYVENVAYAELFDLGSVADLSAVAIFLWLVAQILLHAVSIREENELTI